MKMQISGPNRSSDYLVRLQLAPRGPIQMFRIPAGDRASEPLGPVDATSYDLDGFDAERRNAVCRRRAATTAAADIVGRRRYGRGRRSDD